MRSSPHIWARFSGAVALILGLLAMMMSAQPVAAQSGNSSIELHNRNCPPNYQGTNYFEDCHADALGAGYVYTFTNVDTGETLERSSNANGNVGFGNLSAGRYTIVGGPPGDVTESYAYCATGTAAEPNQEQIPVSYVSGGIQFTLPADTNVICDWYTIPVGQAPADPTPTPTDVPVDPTPTDAPAANSSIEVHHRVCPTDYEGTNWFEDCHANVADPGLPFTFADGATREGTTNENGNVGFANLPASTYSITGGAPGEFADRFVYCSPETSQQQVPTEAVTGGIQVDLATSTNLVCDWYTIPLSQDGQTPPPTEPVAGDSSVEVHARVCPEDYQGRALTDWYQDCHDTAPDPGLPFTFTDGETREGETNENGNVGFANMAAGTWTITGGAPGDVTDLFVSCTVENTGQEVAVEYVTGGVQLDLAANTNVVCDWYIVPQSQQEETPTATQPAAGDSSIEVHHRICPVAYEGPDYFEDCHDTAPDPGLSFTFADGVTREGTTNENGNLGFANLPAGIYSITGGVPGEFADSYVYCAVGTAAEPNQEQIPVEDVPGGIQLDLPANTNVICDWYEIPYDLQGGDPTATPPSGEQFDLPIYKLVCEAAPSEQAASDFVMLGAAPDGCVRFAGVTVTVTDADGTELGGCVTAVAAPCYVTVPIGTTVVATEDQSALPEVYAPVNGATHEVEIVPNSEAWALFINVPSEG